MKEFIIEADESTLFYMFKHYEPLTRCKDCEWYYGDYCGGFGDGAFTPEDGFCHNAERKEE